jgi:NADPH-dependent 2,4-dienoyl-CoA reductase/sulfur reductase-like enzyme
VELVRADVAIVGGGLGACAAALAAARPGYRVILTEETHWVGGQPTNQAGRLMNTVNRGVRRHSQLPGPPARHPGLLSRPRTGPDPWVAA